MPFKSETTIIGDMVICDTCGANYTNSDAKGGIQFLSKAVCPKCAPEMEKNAKKYDEMHCIKSRCPEEKSFAQWVREDLRNGEPGYITVTSLDDL